MNRTREFFTFFIAGALFATAMHMTETTVAYPTMPVELRDACQVADWHPDCRMLKMINK